jgi:hypothetical protein
MMDMAGKEGYPFQISFGIGSIRDRSRYGLNRNMECYSPQDFCSPRSNQTLTGRSKVCFAYAKSTVIVPSKKITENIGKNKNNFLTIVEFVGTYPRHPDTT